MTTKNFLTVSSAIFFLIAVLHVLRLIQGWSVTINSWTVPTWASWISILVAGVLAYQGRKLLK